MCPQPSPALTAAGSCSHLVSHGCHCAGQWGSGMEDSNSWRHPGVPAEAGPQALSSFRHHSNWILQLSPLLCFAPSLPGTHLRPAVPSPVSPGLSPGQGSTASKTPQLLCRHIAFLRSSTQKRPRKPRAGKPNTETPNPLWQWTGTWAAWRSLSVGKGAAAQVPAKPGSNPNTKKATTSPSPAVYCFGGSRPDSQGFLADKPLPAAPFRAEQPFLCLKPTQPHVGCGKENKSFQDKLTLLPGAALSTWLRHDLQPAKKKSDLVKMKGKVLPRDDGKRSEGQLQLSPEGACPAPALCLDSIQISLLEMGAVDCPRRCSALLMCSQPCSFLENSKYLLRQHRRAHTPPSATTSPGHCPGSPFRPSVPPVCPPWLWLEGSSWLAGL